MTTLPAILAPELDHKGRIREGQPLIRCAYGTADQPRERGLCTLLVRDVEEARHPAFWRALLHEHRSTQDYRGQPVPVAFELQHLPLGAGVHSVAGMVAAMRATRQWIMAPVGAMPPVVQSPPPRWVRVRFQLPGLPTFVFNVERDPVYERDNVPTYSVSITDAFGLLQKLKTMLPGGGR